MRSIIAPILLFITALLSAPALAQDAPADEIPAVFQPLAPGAEQPAPREVALPDTRSPCVRSCDADADVCATDCAEATDDPWSEAGRTAMRACQAPCLVAVAQCRDACE